MSNPTPSSKDTLLQNHDILIHIFSFFIPSDPSLDTGKWRRQLLNLALVNKAFLEPALDCLWSHVESLEPLFKLHPALCKVVEPYYFRGEMYSPDSSRYHQYAQRIRTVHFKDASSSNSYHIGGSGFAWLGRQLREDSLLPGLQNIHFQHCSAGSLHVELLPLMLSSTIERVEFGESFLNLPLFHSYALPLVCDGASSLKTLVLHDETPRTSTEGNHNYWDSLVKVADRLRGLVVQFPSGIALDTHTLQRLCTRLENVTSLTLDVHTPSHQPSDSSPSLSKPILPALQELHIINRSEANLCPCYPSFLLDKATSMTFDLTQSVTESKQFKATLDVISTSQSLRKVEVNGCNQHVTPRTIIWFLQRLSLEELHFNVRALNQTQASDPAREIVQSLIEAASKDPTKCRLQRLVLPIWRQIPPTYDLFYESSDSDSDGRADPEFSSLSCLVLVAQRVKGLQHLSLSIDSSKLGPNKETITSMIQNWNEPDTPSDLRHLEIADMRNSIFTPNEYRNIARLLDMIFPNLRSVTTIQHERPSKQWEEHWELIEEHRRMMRTIRLDRGYCL